MKRFLFLLLSVFLLAGNSYSGDIKLSRGLRIANQGNGTDAQVAAAWTPASLTTALVGWWTFDNVSYLYQDSAKTTAVASDGDVIGAVEDRSGNGYDMTQATTGNKPTYQSDGASLINGLAVGRFDGADDYLINANNFSSETQGTVWAIFKLIAGFPDYSTLFSSADEATAAESVVSLRAYFNAGNPQLFTRQRSNADVNDGVAGSTTTSAGNVYYAVFSSNGTAYSTRLNGVAETLSVVDGANTGDWFGDTVNRDSFTIGVTKWNALVGPIKADLLEIGMTNVIMTGDNLTNLEAYLKTRTGL